ncbi:MAG: homocysteine S-methyltransferase family protein [Erythrobacter sp.]|uniref:homocysteine S-methyltransferase family protein n=1 Tax=Erythrobacter sp. TaxID=1042 RepID=UPI0025D81EE0|nr:homocysteine S-methyltransferase family protein [Erythrobacter sp.]MCL9998541.1 homocysteine S-methyltransferase family protein [Erythrobacter sp.]
MINSRRESAMPQARLPQLQSIFLTDAGLETDLIFNHGIDLPHFASIALLASASGTSALENYFRDFLDLAVRKNCGIVLESATWRASPDWAEPLGLTGPELDSLNQAAIIMLQRLREEYRAALPAIVISGCIGPRGDGYDPGRIMTVDEAQTYHTHQTGRLVAAGADQVSGITMTNVPEAIGIALAARAAQSPVALSFTVENDGRLPTGQSLASAIAAVDAATEAYPAYYMINCAHPTHFDAVLASGGDWVGRIGGLRANASRCSHAELDAMQDLDKGNAIELAADYGRLRERFPHINVLGGCCGTDLSHVAAIAEACI